MHPLISSETNEDLMIPLAYDCPGRTGLRSAPPRI